MKKIQKTMISLGFLPKKYANQYCIKQKSNQLTFSDYLGKNSGVTIFSSNRKLRGIGMSGVT